MLIKEPKTQRKVGDLQPKYYLTYRDDKTFFIKYQGFGIALSIIETLIAWQTPLIYVQYRGKKGKTVYETTPKEWLSHGIPYKHKDFEEQLILPIKYFRVV